MRDTGRVIVRSPRISERRRAVRAERRRRRIRGAFLLLLTSSLAAGGWGLTRTPVFALDRIEIDGVPRAEHPAILAAAGLRVGQPALGIDLEGAAAAIRRLRSVEDARVIRTGTLSLRVEVQPRTAAVVVHTQGSRVLLDKRGEPVGVRTKRALPVIKARTAAETVSMVEPVLAIWRDASSSERKRFDSFRLTRAGITAMVGETAVVFGDAEQTPTKLRALRLLLRRVASEDLSPRRIDLRAPARPAIRLA